MDYRMATVDDCVPLTELRMEMRRERDPNFNREELYDTTLSFFQRNIACGNHVVLLCEDQEKVVATVELTFFEMPPTGKLRYTGVAKLMNMYTIPSYRRRGISREMMRRAVELARAKGCEKIMLNSSPMGQPLYESFGFSRIPNEYELYLENP